MTRLQSLIAAAALAGTAAAPAAAQYGQYQQPYQPPYQQQQQYPQYPQTYPQQQQQYPQSYPPQQPYQQGAPSYPYSGQNYGDEQAQIGTMVDTLIGNRYAASDRQAIQSCAWAAVQRARSYGVSGYGGGYNNGYGYGRHLRVLSINDVERRTLILRVRGTLGRGGGYGTPGYGNPGYGAPGYGGSYARPEFSFRCDVGYNGYVQNVRVESLYRNY